MKKQNTEELRKETLNQLLTTTIIEVDKALDEFVKTLRDKKSGPRCPSCGFWITDKEGLRCNMCPVFDNLKRIKNEKNNPRDARVPDGRRTRLPE